MQLPSNVVRTDFAGLARLSADDPHPRQLQKRIPLLEFNMRGNETYYLALQGRSIVAAAATADDPAFHPSRDLGFVGVDPNFEGRGHARRILECVFHDAAQDKMILVATHFSEAGWKRLPELYVRLHQQYPDVGVQWDIFSSQITYGHRPYKLVRKGSVYNRVVKPL